MPAYCIGFLDNPAGNIHFQTEIRATLAQTILPCQKINFRGHTQDTLQGVIHRESMQGLEFDVGDTGDRWDGKQSFGAKK